MNKKINKKTSKRINRKTSKKISKNISSELAIGVILLVAIIVGGIVWMAENKQPIENQQVSQLAPIISKQESPIKKETPVIQPVADVAEYDDKNDDESKIHFIKDNILICYIETSRIYAKVKTDED